MDKRKESEESIPRWINHFEKQAKIGISSRSYYNKRVIIVYKVKEGEKKFEDKINEEKTPDIISPVQQVVEQAEEDIKREESATNGILDTDNVIGTNKEKKKRRVINNNKRKNIFTGRAKTKKFRDIFTTGVNGN